MTHGHLDSLERDVSGTKQLTLRYGVILIKSGTSLRPRRRSPFQGTPLVTWYKTLTHIVLNGAPGYVNLLDALYSWPLVKELTLA